MKMGKGARVLFVFVLLLIYVPVAVMVLYSFNSSAAAILWESASLKWYERLFHDRDLLVALRNSLILGVTSSVAAGIIGTLGAIGLAKMKSKAKGIIDYISLLPLMIPEITLGVVLMLFFSAIGIPFGMFTLIIAHTSFCIPYVLMVVKARLVGLPESYQEAARDLGASRVRAFFTITLPLILPGIVSGMLLSFAMSLDDVVISLFVTGATVNTLPIKIYTQTKTGITPEMNALGAVMLLATLILILLSRLIGRRRVRV